MPFICKHKIKYAKLKKIKSGKIGIRFRNVKRDHKTIPKRRETKMEVRINEKNSEISLSFV